MNIAKGRKRKVLIVSFLFPPLNDIGALHSRQKVSGEVFGQAREVFRAAGMYPSGYVKVSGQVCCQEAERRKEKLW